MTRNMTCGIASAGRLPGGASLGSPQREYIALHVINTIGMRFGCQVGHQAPDCVFVSRPVTRAAQPRPLALGPPTILLYALSQNALSQATPGTHNAPSK